MDNEEIERNIWGSNSKISASFEGFRKLSPDAAGNEADKSSLTEVTVNSQVLIVVS